MATLSRPRTRQRRRRRDHPPARVTLARGLVLVVVAGFLGYEMLSLYNGVPTTNYGKVFVSTPVVGNLLSHDAVRIAGKRVGQVANIDVGDDGKPRVELQLNPGTKLSSDSTVRIRANGLLGARYVELIPGKSPTLLSDGAVISGTQWAYTYGLPETVDVFDSQTRTGLRRTLRGLGAGVLANGADGNQTLKMLRVATPQFTDVMQAIEARKRAAERLFPATLSTFRVFRRNTQYVAPWTKAVGDALQPFITERQATRDTLTEAPPALAAADDGLARGSKLLTAVRDLSSAAALTLPPAPQGVRALAQLLDAGRAPIKAALPLTGQARGGIEAAYQLLPGLRPILPRLNQALDASRPVLQELHDHACDFKNGAATLRSMTGFEQTGNGERGRGMAFRLQLVAPGLEGVGVGGPGTLIKRAVYPDDCHYRSKPYPQFTNDGTATRSVRP